MGAFVEEAEQRRRRAVELGREIIHAAAPGLLTVRQIATQVQEEMGGVFVNVRKDLRSGIGRGALIELCPDSAWRVMWPEAARWGFTRIWIGVQLYKVGEKQEATRLVLASHVSQGRPRRVAPNHLTYLTTHENAVAFLREAARLRQERSVAPQG